MQFTDVWIPCRGYWSSPFCAWQGSFASRPPIPFAAELAAGALADRGVPPSGIDGLCLGTTVPSRHSFYGAAWFAGLAGLGYLNGPTINQACATSVRCLIQAAQELASGSATVYLAAAADRCYNGPHLYYPDPAAPGGAAAVVRPGPGQAGVHADGHRPGGRAGAGRGRASGRAIGPASRPTTRSPSMMSSSSACSGSIPIG